MLEALSVDPRTLMSEAIRTALPIIPGAISCWKGGLREAEHKNTLVPYPIPRGSHCRHVSITGAFCSSYIDTDPHKRAGGSETGRPCCNKSLSPWINSLLIQDNGAWELERLGWMGRVPCRGMDGLGWAGGLRLLGSRDSGHWATALTFRSSTTRLQVRAGMATEAQCSQQ